jgi:hypothetical protein
MKSMMSVLSAALSAAALALLGGPISGAAQVGPNTPDSLYIGDAADNTIKRFDAQTGAFFSVFVQNAGLRGPRGILHVGSNLLVSNQNVNEPFPGEIDQFSIANGKSLGGLVPSTSPDAPFAPRGIIVGPNGILFVADFGSSNIGRVEQYDVVTGRFLGNLNFDSFINSSASNGEFHPRGLVFGPDGRLYVTLFSEQFFPRFGWVLRVDLTTGSVSVFTDNGPTAGATGCTKDLNAPEGVTFGPDGRLYVASLRADRGDVDRILILSAAGVCLDEIALDQVGGPRARAHAIVFGPGGSLFVPIDASQPTGACPCGPDAGAVRRYDVNTKTFTTFVSPGGSLVIPWYLTFGNTSPSTLAYVN